jgi:hypothetical protein|tara:strand:+ start:312 stop:506 length:195 start_codon:yes stop_codon:yes gene_type:complete
MLNYKLADKVKKTKGYSFNGIIVSVFQKINGDWRYVVECTIPGAEGMLHVFNHDNLELDNASQN